MSRLSPETEALLQRGRARAPMTSDHRARLKTAILAKAAGGAVVMTGTTAAGWASAMKFMGVGVLVATMGAGVAVGTGAWHPMGRPVAEQVVSAGPPAKGVTSVFPGRSAAVNASTSAATAIADSTAVLNPTPPTPTPTARPIPMAMAIGTPLPRSRAPAIPNGPQTPASPMSMAIAPPAPAIPNPTTPNPSTPNPTTPTPPATLLSPSSTDPLPSSAPAFSAPLSTLEREAALLREADLATRHGDSSRALALLAEHATSFPRSALEPERSAERVFALCHAGRVGEAESEAAKFLRNHPDGPLAARVRASCHATRP